nr:MAG TPA: hypothetical protein [Bacteriophage sp.]
MPSTYLENRLSFCLAESRAAAAVSSSTSGTRLFKSSKYKSSSESSSTL